VIVLEQGDIPFCQSKILGKLKECGDLMNVIVEWLKYEVNTS
jgi:hypothetical protein